jgi:hypothetical protein
MATNNPIMSDYSTLEQINRENDLTAIEVQRGIGSYFPIFVSLGITLYGFFLFLQTIIDTEYVIYGTLAFLGILLIYIEHHRAGLISDFLGSKLEKLINKLATIPRIGLMMGVAITILFIALDTWGAMQSADSIERMLLSGIVKNSEQYKIEEAKAKSGANEAKAYQQQLREWRTAKSEHYKGCDASWRVPTYRTKNQQCKDKFREAKPTAVNNTDGTIPISIYNEMEAKAKGEVTGYRKMFFWVFLGFSILLNYFAMASLFNQYRTKRKELTPEMIDELTDRMELMNAEKINKISMSTKAQKQKLEEKNFIDVEIEKETYNIVIAKRAKALMRKKDIPLKIMNNENIMEDKRAGHVFNPFYNETNETNETIIKNNMTNTIGSEFTKVSQGGRLKLGHKFIEDNRETLDKMAKNGTLIKINNEYWANTDNIFKGNPKTIMMRLFKNTTVKANEKLTPKTQVIDIDQRRQTEAIVKVYKKLQELKIIERKGSNGGYYALKALTEKDINDLEDKYFTKKEGFIYNKQPYMGAK